MVHHLQLEISVSTQPTQQIFKILSIREHGSYGYLFLLCCYLGSAGLLPVVWFVLLQSLVLPVLQSCPFAACSTKPSSRRLPRFAGIP